MKGEEEEEEVEKEEEEEHTKTSEKNGKERESEIVNNDLRKWRKGNKDGGKLNKDKRKKSEVEEVLQGGGCTDRTNFHTPVVKKA